jgi:competence protein CoiA
MGFGMERQMKYAIVEGERREAEPGLLGECPLYGHSMIAKCGDQRDWHWAHRGKYTCDRWWEPETEWHRAWKNHFPKPWQEFVQHSESGEKHIADVKTDLGVVLEFQHSFLRRDEREARELFYQKMVWVVYGLRRKRDAAQFFASLNAGTVVHRTPAIVSVLWKEGALLRDWGASRVPVYFDFGMPTLWRLNPSGPHRRAYLSPMQKTEFSHIHVEGLPFEEEYSAAVERVAAGHLIQRTPQPLPRLERYMARRQRTRPRF